ncbi:MAG: addiction module protein [Flavobacteriales bacterium]
MNIETRKISIVQYILGLQRDDILGKIEDIISSNSSEDIQIPEWQKQEVKQRLEEYRRNPDSAIDFDKAMDDIEKDL